MALGTTKISTTLVGTTLGTSSRDVGTLCTHPAINKWSRWKPVSIAKITGITETDLESIDYGFSIPEYETPYGALNAVLAGAGWDYNKPTGGSYSPFRLGDFRNYEHFAQDWFTFTAEGTGSVETGKSWRASIAEDIGWIISNFNKFSFVFNGTTPIGGILDLGLILRSTSSSQTASNCYYYKICDWLDMDTEKPFNMVLPENALPLGNYNIIPVITSSTNFANGTVTFINQNSTLQGNWYLLPVNVLTVGIVLGGTSIIQDISFVLNSYVADIDPQTYMVNISSILLEVTNANEVSVDVIINYAMTDAVSGNIGGTIVATLPAQETTTVELIRASTYPNGLIYESAFNQPIAHVTLTYAQSKIEHDLQLF